MPMGLIDRHALSRVQLFFPVSSHRQFVFPHCKFRFCIFGGLA